MDWPCRVCWSATVFAAGTKFLAVTFRLANGLAAEAALVSPLAPAGVVIAAALVSEEFDAGMGIGMPIWAPWNCVGIAETTPVGTKA